jgi:integrase
MEAAVVSEKKPKLLDRVRSDLRAKHYSIRTEKAYIDWIRRFILFHSKRHPNEMGEQEISAFLTHLAVDRHVAASTQNQAFCALLFLYQQVLQRKLDFIDDVARVKRPAKIPVVFTREEARTILDHLHGEYQLMSELLYGSGLRLMECVRLRVKDIDFGYGHIIVRDGKGLRDRVTLLPERLRRPLQLHLERVKELHLRDIGKGGGRRLRIFQAWLFSVHTRAWRYTDHLACDEPHCLLGSHWWSARCRYLAPRDRCIRRCLPFSSVSCFRGRSRAASVRHVDIRFRNFHYPVCATHKPVFPPIASNQSLEPTAGRRTEKAEG